MKHRLPIVLCALGLLVSLAAPVGAADLEEDLAEIQAQVSAVNAEIDAAASDRNAVAGELVATQGRLDEMVVDLNRTRLQLDVTREQLATRVGELEGVRRDLEAMYADLTMTRRRVADSRSDAEQWARQLYMNAGQDEAYLALSADELVDISIGLGYLSAIAADNERIIITYEALRQTEQRQTERVALRQAELAADVAALGSVEVELAELEAKQAEQRAAIEAEIGRQRNLLTDLESEIARFEGELASLEAEQSRIEAAIRAELSSGGSAPGQFVRPVPGSVTSPFGPRTHPILGYVRMHTGVDFNAPYGQPIRAAAGGRVILAGTYGGYGTTIVIDHGGGTATLYAHQSSVAVGYGQQVAAGDTVGYVGSTGLSTGPHLHFEVRVDGVPVDPMQYL